MRGDEQSLPAWGVWIKNEYGHLQLYMTRTPSRNKSIVAECGEKYGKTGAEQIQR